MNYVRSCAITLTATLIINGDSLRIRILHLAARRRS